MVLPAKQAASYEDLLALPENVVGEIVGGDLYVSPRPAALHALATVGAGSDLHGPFQRGRGGPGGWWILFEPELHLGTDVLVPDIAGWRRERLPTISNVAAFELRPDWVCEVVSPRTAHLDRGRKMDAYAHAGVPHLWIIDPLAMTLEVYRLSDANWLRVATYAGDALVRAEPFEAVELDLSGWWSPQADDAVR
jgi:hypothetical protein